MKNRFVLLLTLLLALLLTGCGAASVPAEEHLPPTDPVVVPPTETAPQETEQEPLRFVVEVRQTSGSAESPDGFRLIETSFRLPEMRVETESGAIVEESSLPEEERALEIAAVFNRHFTEWNETETISGLVESAYADLKFYQEEGLDWYGGHTHDLACTVYQTERLVSVSGLYYAGTGGAHPNTYLLGWNFDLSSGSFIGADALVGREDLRAAVTEELLRQAGERAEEEGMAPEEFFWTEYADILADWPSYAVTFDAEGMHVGYSPYELAAYAAGAQEFFVDYELMRPYLDAEGLEILGLD